jgi:hypothetical protein
MATGFISLPFLREPPAYSRFALNSGELRRESDKLDQMLQARNRFMAIEDEIFCMLAQEQLTLIEACDHLYQCARDINPRYLRFLPDPKKNLKERMADNIIGFFRLEAAEKSSSYTEIVLRLEREIVGQDYRDWCNISWPAENQNSAPSCSRSVQ